MVVTKTLRKLRSGRLVGKCSCKRGSCPKCFSPCRRCGCDCDGISPTIALKRNRGRHRQRNNNDDVNGVRGRVTKRKQQGEISATSSKEHTDTCVLANNSKKQKVKRESMQALGKGVRKSKRRSSKTSKSSNVNTNFSSCDTNTNNQSNQNIQDGNEVQEVSNNISHPEDALRKGVRKSKRRSSKASKSSNLNMNFSSCDTNTNNQSNQNIKH